MQKLPESVVLHNKKEENNSPTKLVNTIPVSFDSLLIQNKSSFGKKVGVMTPTEITSLMKASKIPKNSSKKIGKKKKNNQWFKAQIVYPDGTKYYGDVGPGFKREGEGVIKWIDGSEYKGQFKNDDCLGYGKFKSSTLEYEGYFIENIPDGFGDLKVGSYIYEGQFFDGLKCGNGYETLPNGFKFKGMFDDGRRCGHGILYDNYGNVIEEKEEWDEDAGDMTEFSIPKIISNASEINLKEYRKMHLTNAFNYHPINEGNEIIDSQYRGEMNSKNQKHGQGIKIFTQGSSPFLRYEGQWKDDKFEGFGNLKFKNGDFYEGSFMSGYFEGDGTYSHKDGRKYEGSWVKGNQTGQGKLQDFEGNVITGEFVNGNASGFVKINYKDGRVYEGMYDQKKIHGRGNPTLNIFQNLFFLLGKMIYPSGEIYEGEFYMEKKKGFGIHKKKDGKIYFGLWENDLPHNFGAEISPSN